MLNWLLRYQPVLDLVDELAPATVLDVGSGVYGLSWYWPGEVVQTDLTFAGEAAPAGRAGQARFVCSTAEQLPFRDRAFDLAVSLDMFEHLPTAIRPGAAAELFRVADGAVLVGYPVGRPASALDRALAFVLRLRPGGTLPLWLREHLEQVDYPTASTVLDLVPPGWQLVRHTRSGNVAVQFLVVLAELLPGLRRLTERAERRLLATGRVPAWVDARPAYRSIFLFARQPQQAAPGQARAST